MKKSVKAALLSAFVFPGAGHIYLKKYLLGVVLLCVSLLSLGFIVSRTVERALQVVAKIQGGEVPADVAAITELLASPALGTDARLLNITSILLFFVWLIGILDSYLVGRKLETAAESVAE